MSEETIKHPPPYAEETFESLQQSTVQDAPPYAEETAAALRQSAVQSPPDHRKEASESLQQSAIKSTVRSPQNVATLSAGDRIDHFRIERLIGEGGMGQVYLAEDDKLGRQVALKLVSAQLASSAHARARFQTEARATAKINHPNIVTIHAVGEHLNRPYVALEYVQGRTLREHLAEQKMSLEQTLHVLAEVADAVAAAHRQGVWHRDLKPTNVLINEDGRAKVLDFGLAKISDRDAELAEVGSAANLQATTAGGTPLYMAPEQWRGDPSSAATDVWALGVLVFEACTRQHPFLDYREGDEARAVAARLRDSVCSPRDSPSMSGRAVVPDKLAQLVASCLSKRPEDRPRAAEVVEALRSLMLSSRGALAAHAPHTATSKPTHTSKPTQQHADVSIATPKAASTDVTSASHDDKRDRTAQWMAGAALLVAVAVAGVVLGSMMKDRTDTAAGDPPVFIPIGGSASIPTQADTSGTATSASGATTPLARSAAAATPSTERGTLRATPPGSIHGPSGPTPNPAPGLSGATSQPTPAPPGSLTQTPPPAPATVSGQCDRTCKKYGMCTRSGSRCMVGSDADCRIHVCTQSGRCVKQGDSCVAKTDSHCRQSAKCRTHGTCTHVRSTCLATAEPDCRASQLCRSEGRCSLNYGSCVAGSDADCQQSAACKTSGRCRKGSRGPSGAGCVK